MAGGKSPTGKQGGKQAEHTHVTLEDVKGKFINFILSRINNCTCVLLHRVELLTIFCSFLGVAYDKTLSELEDVAKDFDAIFG